MCLKKSQKEGNHYIQENLRPIYSFNSCTSIAFPGDSDSKESTCNAGNVGSIPGSGRSPGEGNGSTLAWRIPWTEEPGGLQSMGSQESDTTE